MERIINNDWRFNRTIGGLRISIEETRKKINVYMEGHDDSYINKITASECWWKQIEKIAKHYYSDKLVDDLLAWIEIMIEDNEDEYEYWYQNEDLKIIVSRTLQINDKDVTNCVSFIK